VFSIGHAACHIYNTDSSLTVHSVGNTCRSSQRRTVSWQCIMHRDGRVAALQLQVEAAQRLSSADQTQEALTITTVTLVLAKRGFQHYQCNSATGSPTLEVVRPAQLALSASESTCQCGSIHWPYFKPGQTDRLIVY